MKIGLFGFPLTGKTTLFNTLTGAHAAVAGFGHGRPETHVGVAHVPDERLDRLAALLKVKKAVHATVEYVDQAGVEKGEGQKSEAFLVDLKLADALAHVVRAFEDANVPHSEGSIDPRRDVETMEIELILADHTVATRRAERLELSLRKAPRDEDRKELDLIRRCVEALERETPLRAVHFSEEEARRLRGFTFLTAKPLLVVLNVGEGDAATLDSAPARAGLEDLTRKPGIAICAASAKIESEIAQLDPADARAFTDEMGLGQPALERIIHSSYDLLGLLSFFTFNEQECRAWAIHAGTSAHRAAGAVHTDIERGFIRAEVVNWKDLLDEGSMAHAREHGRLRLEGKEYVVRDGDVIHFRFNV